MRKIALAATLLASFAVAPRAHASGPVERLMQLLVHPSQPNTLIVRYGAGAGSHGFLFSRDGGATFQLMCSANVAPDSSDVLTIQRISQRAIPSTAALVLDHTGAITYSQYGSSWADDGTGCTWGDVPALEDKWPLGLEVDPRDPTLVWSVVSTTPTAGTQEAGTFDLWQRDANKTWARKGPVRTIDPARAVVDATLVVFANATQRRLYTSMFVQGAQGVSEGYVLSSDDDGATWREHALPKEQERLNLIAVDPQDPNLLLAAISRDGSADTLLLSRDGGATFASYLELRALGGITFDGTGRIYVGDIGDASSVDAVGGLFTAARTGDPLTLVPNTAGIDCVQWKDEKLYVCNGDRFGTMDPATGVIESLIRIQEVDQLLSCEGKDMALICKDQLNSGPSWCCAGHYPFTPLCGEYDVTSRPGGGRVYCGLSGREYDMPGSTTDAGSAPEDASVQDASVPDAGVDARAPRADASDEAPRAFKDGGGCAVAGGRMDAAWLLALALLLRRRQRGTHTP